MKKPNVINAKKCKECNVPKGWGHEIVFENNEGTIFEVSTHHCDSDSYRVWRGDSQ